MESLTLVIRFRRGQHRAMAPPNLAVVPTLLERQCAQRGGCGRSAKIAQHVERIVPLPTTSRRLPCVPLAVRAEVRNALRHVRARRGLARYGHAAGAKRIQN